MRPLLGFGRLLLVPRWDEVEVGLTSFMVMGQAAGARTAPCAACRLCRCHAMHVHPFKAAPFAASIYI